MTSDFISIRGQSWGRAACEEHQYGVRVVRTAIAAARTGDIDTFAEILNDIEFAYAGRGWPRVLRAIARSPQPLPPAFGEYLFHRMIESGEYLRQEAGDLPLIAALRAISPPYAGVSLRLYRGEAAPNRRRRTYGISWTLDRAVAAVFAAGLQQSAPGGSVLLETDAPAAAIIRVCVGGRHEAEQEVWVDRRALGQVRVLQRYAHRPP
jgi:hypothetical protein